MFLVTNENMGLCLYMNPEKVLFKMGQLQLTMMCKYFKLLTFSIKRYSTCSFLMLIFNATNLLAKLPKRFQNSQVTRTLALHLRERAHNSDYL